MAYSLEKILGLQTLENQKYLFCRFGVSFCHSGLSFFVILDPRCHLFVIFLSFCCHFVVICLSFFVMLF